MAENNIVYIKQTGERSIPVTVRIKWLPDGTIKPIKYWTPDGSMYKIKHISETVMLVFLKNRGEGIRFRVRSQLIESSDPFSEIIHSQYETYLFLEDNFFCGKNFIDERYHHGCKEYIPVILDIFPDGDYEVIYFTVHENRYMVEKTIKKEPRGSYNAGGVGICHKVEARHVNPDNDEDFSYLSERRMAALYLEINKWFVYIKNSSTGIIQKLV